MVHAPWGTFEELALGGAERALASASVASWLHLLDGAGGLRRTAPLLHEAGPVLEEPPPLSEEVALQWLETFAWQRVLLVLFLGPGRGVLELRPFDEDGLPLRLPTEPGMLVALRADRLWRLHSAPARRSYALSSFLVDARPWEVWDGGRQRCPCKRAASPTRHATTPSTTPQHRSRIPNAAFRRPAPRQALDIHGRTSTHPDM